MNKNHRFLYFNSKQFIYNIIYNKYLALLPINKDLERVFYMTILEYSLSIKFDYSNKNHKNIITFKYIYINRTKIIIDY